ncbi:MAG: glycosyltransferase family 2 protein [Desulfuromonadaceae bacterium]|nr:glycosyltransferase family 2 protein [Desulfuromonadaceae bacterium]
MSRAISNHVNRPFISIVMPIRNEAYYIKDTLASLLSQDYPPDRYEIIVADGESDDGTQAIIEEIAQSHAQIRLMNNPGRKSGAGRNIGFRNGKGDYFLVVDGHCYIPDDQLFRTIVDCFAKSGADCLGRPQPLDPPGLTSFQKSIALARASRLGHGGESLIFGEYEGFASPVSNGAAYARHVFDKIGYVDENFDAAEDVEFNYRVEQAGLTCYTSPRLTVRYYPRENLRGLFRQMARYGKGRRKFIRKHREALTLNQLIPAAFVAGLICLICSLALYLFSGVYILLLTAVPYGLYLTFVMAESVRITLGNGLRHGMPIPAILFVIHFALGYGFLKETFYTKTVR